MKTLFRTLIIFMLFTSSSIADEDDTVNLCAMKGAFFGMAWQVTQADWIYPNISKQKKESGIAERMRIHAWNEGVPNEVRDLWIIQMYAAMDHPDMMLMMNDIVNDCLELGY